jgi:hypothetical protein
VPVIGSDKREAFAQGSASDEAIQTGFAVPWIASLTLAMTEKAANPDYSASVQNPCSRSD